VTPGDRARAADILAAAEGLERRLTMTFDEWMSNEDLRLITERLVEIVGEACRALSDDYRTQRPDIDWTGFIGLRNVLVHAYHRVQPDLLWEAATVDVPALTARLRDEAAP
jgi:uncharacterized protein with HEPN domain